MKYLKIISAIVITALSAGCKKSNDYMVDPSKYIYPIPQVDLTEDARVGAYYFAYSATDWNGKREYTPLLGNNYSATDPAVMQQQIQWADQGGVNFFAFKWDGTTGNSVLDNFKSVSSTGSTKMVIEYSTAHLKATNASPLTGSKLATFSNEWRMLINNYVSTDAYYKIEGRPVVILSPLNLSSSTLNSINYKLVADTLRSIMAGFGMNPYIIGELTTGWVAPINYPDSVLKAMDAIVANTWSTNDYDRMFAFYSYSDLNYQNWKKTLESWDVDYVPTIFPGWNNPGTPAQYVIERSEKNYVDYMNVAKRSMGSERMVMINSWNDFNKGNSLEPTVEYGTEYLELTKRELKK